MNAAFQISHLDWLKLIFLSILWGMSFIFMEIAIEELDTFTVAFFRVVIAALALHFIIAVQGRNLWQYRKFFGTFFIMGIIGIALPFSLIIWGQIYITASLSSILNGALPFFTLIVAHFFTHDEKMTLRRVVALMVGFVGVVIIIGPAALSNQAILDGTLGQAAVLVATFCYAVVTVYGRRIAKLGVPGLVVATGQMTIASLVLLPLMFWEAPWQHALPSFEIIAALAGMGLLSTALAFTVWHNLLPRIGSNNLSLVTFMIPVSTVTIGYLVLGETLSTYQMVGMGIVALGLVLMNGRLWRFFWPNQSHT